MVAHKRFKLGIDSRYFIKLKAEELSYQDKLVVLEPSYAVKTYFAMDKNNADSKALNQMFSKELKNFKQTHTYRQLLKKYQLQ